MQGKPRVGILAVQGDFEAHGEVLSRLGVEHIFVRTPGDLAGLDALILPGGESTTQLRFLSEERLDKASAPAAWPQLGAQAILP